MNRLIVNVVPGVSEALAIVSPSLGTPTGAERPGIWGTSGKFTAGVKAG